MTHSCPRRDCGFSSAVCGPRSIKARIALEARDRGEGGVANTTILLQDPVSKAQRTLLRNVTRRSFPFNGPRETHQLVARTTDRAGNVSPRYTFTLRCPTKTKQVPGPAA